MASGRQIPNKNPLESKYSAAQRITQVKNNKHERLLNACTDKMQKELQDVMLIYRQERWQLKKELNHLRRELIDKQRSEAAAITTAGLQNKSPKYFVSPYRSKMSKSASLDLSTTSPPTLPALGESLSAGNTPRGKVRSPRRKSQQKNWTKSDQQKGNTDQDGKTDDKTGQNLYPSAKESSKKSKRRTKEKQQRRLRPEDYAILLSDSYDSPSEFLYSGEDSDNLSSRETSPKSPALTGGKAPSLPPRNARDLMDSSSAVSSTVDSPPPRRKKRKSKSVHFAPDVRDIHRENRTGRYDRSKIVGLRLPALKVEAAEQLPAVVEKYMIRSLPFSGGTDKEKSPLTANVIIIKDVGLKTKDFRGEVTSRRCSVPTQTAHLKRNVLDPIIKSSSSPIAKTDDKKSDTSGDLSPADLIKQKIDEFRAKNCAININPTQNESKKDEKSTNSKPDKKACSHLVDTGGEDEERIRKLNHLVDIVLAVKENMTGRKPNNKRRDSTLCDFILNRPRPEEPGTEEEEPEKVKVERKAGGVPQNTATRINRKNNLAQLKSFLRQISRDLPMSEQIKLEEYRRELMLDSENKNTDES